MTIGALELEVLREIAGECEKRKHDPASFMRAVAGLRGTGYLDRLGDVTPEGVAALRREDAT